MNKNVQKSPQSDMKSRTISLFLMFLGFFIFLSMGHFYSTLLVIGCTVRGFYELMKLKIGNSTEKYIVIQNQISWYFFILAVIYYLISYFEDLHLTHLKFLNGISEYKRLIFFILFILGMITFIKNLKQKTVKDQIFLLFWSWLVTAYAVIGLCGVIVIYKGLIWFFIVILLVTSNDTFALLGGKFFGQRQLWKLSPKKTVEGFICGFLGTICFGILIHFLSQKEFMNPFLCPQTELNIIPFQYPNCELDYKFQQRYIFIPFLSHLIGPIFTNEFAIHLSVCVIFASFIAPFGGFFASGLKRALNIKDFSDIIPGHGGVVDRLDCVWLMMIFVWIYLTEVVEGRVQTLGSVFSYINTLDNDDLRILHEKLGSILELRINQIIYQNFVVNQQ